MKSLETLKTEPILNEVNNKGERLETDGEQFALNFENEMELVEAKRLRKPERSFYDNLKRFSQRAVWLGSLISALAASPSALSQTYRPYIIETATGRFVPIDSSKNKTPEIENKLKETRSLIERILTRMGETEKLPLAKLDVNIAYANFSQGAPVTAGFSQERIFLEVCLIKSFDLEKHAKALEALLAHEIGHFINEQADQDITKQMELAERQAFSENPEINKEWQTLELKRGDIESMKAPQLKGITEKIRELSKKLATEDLTAAEALSIRTQMDSFEEQTSKITSDLRKKDKNYDKITERQKELKEDLRPLTVKYLIEQGGPEVIADFFQARWVVKQGWSADEQREAIKALIGESGPSQGSRYVSTVEKRHELAQFFFREIKKDPEKYYKIGSNRADIHKCIESLYKEFLGKN